ncbi:hypothetical protein LX83_005776 [Goodfellowiella coeruleoviolacea]|uniref:Uncharacterized protein n=1 Tax=Goodfellowiella coeruleoviolacea TaxID=334858 RepID=A0AAE3GIN1_9PSEU|nr:hypothetical protein [Goodfellowiella coeruleoviolacea]
MTSAGGSTCDGADWAVNSANCARRLVEPTRRSPSSFAKLKISPTLFR